MKYIELLKEFLEEELGEYSYFSYSIEFDEETDDDEYYRVKISGGDRTQYLSFKLNEIKIEVEISEGSWYEVCTYEYNIKYFWIALLKW